MFQLQYAMKNITFIVKWDILSRNSKHYDTHWGSPNFVLKFNFFILVNWDIFLAPKIILQIIEFQCFGF